MGDNRRRREGRREIEVRKIMREGSARQESGRREKEKEGERKYKGNPRKD